jgi:hypothetical protein
MKKQTVDDKSLSYKNYEKFAKPVAKVGLEDRELLNVDVKRIFTVRHADIQQLLRKIFFEEDPKVTYDKLLDLIMDDKNDSVWLNILEESLFLLGPADPSREQLLLNFLRLIPQPKKIKSVQLFVQRVHQILNDLDVGYEVKFNILFVFLYLGDIALNWKVKQRENSDEEEEENEDEVTTPIKRLVINNRNLNSLWSLVNTSDVQIKIVALSILHTYIEHYESPFPSSIEELLESHVRKSLAFHRNTELKFLSHFIARYSFGEPIDVRVEELDKERKNKITQAGIGKMYINPHENILIDNDGLVVRNNTLHFQIATVPETIAGAIRQGRWYWEITASSVRYLKVGYCYHDNFVEGKVLALQR